MKNLSNLIVAFALAVFIFLFHNLPSNSVTLKFVQLSDIHYSKTRNDTSFKMLSDSKNLLQDAISQINKLNNVDFVMVTGDGIDSPSKNDAKELFSMLNEMKFPWYFSLGNHDTTTSGYLKKDKFVELLKESNQSYVFDEAYYSFVPKKGFKVIVIDGAKNRGISMNGNIPEEQLKWLDEELKNSKKDVVLIFLHFPLLEPFPSSHHRILNADEFYAVLDKYKNPIALFTGHYHTTKITKSGNILHVSSPALVTYPNAFRVVSVTNYRKKVIFDFYFYETGLKKVQEKARLMTFGSSSYSGRDSDRTTTVVIDK